MNLRLNGFNAEKIFVQAVKLLYTESKEIAKNQQENKIINKKLENINNINNIVKNKKNVANLNDKYFL